LKPLTFTTEILAYIITYCIKKLTTNRPKPKEQNAPSARAAAFYTGRELGGLGPTYSPG